jgi:hypothetical protein
MEARLRGALSARADLVTNRDLAPWPIPEPAPVNRTPWYVAGGSVAAAVAAAVVISLGGWDPVGSGATSVSVAQGGGTASVGTAADGTGAAVDGTGAAGAAASQPGVVSTPSAGAPTSGAEGSAPRSSTPGSSAAATGSTAGAGAASSSGSVSVCTPATVSAFVLPDTDARPHGGGMNHQGATVGITNIGAAACRVYGYLGVGLYNGDTLESAPTTLRGDTGYARDPGPASIVLPPGGSAYTELGWSSADGIARAVEVTQIRVILPDQRQQITIAFSSVVGGRSRELLQTALTPAPLPLTG